MDRFLISMVFLCALSLAASPALAQREKQPAAAAATGGQSVCQPKPGKSDCEACHETQCCEERRACEADPACVQYGRCRKGDCTTPPCEGKCGTPPATYVAQFSCQMTGCNRPVCGGPVDGCTLCASTRCAAATLVCLNQPGCYEYATCREECGQAADCLARCQKPSQAAVTAAQAKMACTRAECRAECSGKAAP